ncbi:uncharacterized protein DNG_06902 [Cephalotrichum gorgonifer]|uniref:Chromatin modification-related protein EAF6 n=1 Tax=Cephalotrichum gorgonifer TaxID=2041049 RepID=A0AAE8N2C0_9PEZI|nr:uncharacterized protein DNG_06902 [Cephalotrichum gorgonifer]
MAAENKKTPGAAAPSPTGPPPTIQEYKKEQARLREMINTQKQLAQRLAQLEESIAQKETAYLESTPTGNIIIGYDGYIKGTGPAANKKKAPTPEQNRVFSRSSTSYRPNTGGDATPGTTPAQTPISANASGNATPTSATVARGKKKKNNNDDESEPDSAPPANGKKRTAFGAARK